MRVENDGFEASAAIAVNTSEWLQWVESRPSALPPLKVKMCDPN